MTQRRRSVVLARSSVLAAVNPRVANDFTETEEDRSAVNSCYSGAQVYGWRPEEPALQDGYQLSGSAARVYEDRKVKAIFGPLARATLEVVRLGPGDRLLDVACGTGIVARSVHERYGAGVTIAGVDLNESMIEMARTLTSGVVPAIEWVVADAADVPFADDAFSVCICQQGLQFMPDKTSAVRELRCRHRSRLSNQSRTIVVHPGGTPCFPLCRTISRLPASHVHRLRQKPSDT